MKRIVVETQHGGDPTLPGATRPTVDRAPPGAMPVQTPPSGVPHQYMLYRGGADDEYTRNAYGDEERNSDFDERNASIEDEYTRNAYGFDEERNAYVEDEYARNAYGDEERNADFDERNAYADEERNAFVDEERNADFEERNDAGDAQYAQMTGGSSM